MLYPIELGVLTVSSSAISSGKITFRMAWQKNSAINTDHFQLSRRIMAGNKPGRKKGGRNCGYFYRKARGWYAVDGRRQTAAVRGRDDIKTENVEEKVLRDA